MALQTAVPVVRTFRSHPSSLYPVRQFIREQAAANALSQAVADDVVLATSEACVNAVLHASTRTVRVTWRCAAGCTEVVVEDEGIFDRQLPMPEIDGPTGRGILLMTALMDEITIREGTPRRPGTMVRLVKCEAAAPVRA
ncbi:MAG: ATP-binding protein [Actinomycetota bacterium]|nr:ATP-binding protein [Actinomycetota bacterium]